MAFAIPFQVGAGIVKSIRPDLNGRRLINEESTRTWLVFNGLRHHVTSSPVYDALFRPGVTFDQIPDLDDVAEGPDLGHGTCLVSDSETVKSTSSSGTVDQHPQICHQDLREFRRTGLERGAGAFRPAHPACRHSLGTGDPFHDAGLEHFFDEADTGSSQTMRHGRRPGAPPDGNRERALLQQAGIPPRPERGRRHAVRPGSIRRKVPSRRTRWWCRAAAACSTTSATSVKAAT